MSRLLAVQLLALAACAGTREDDTLVAITYIEAPYEQVWASFTEAERYAAWFSAPCLEFGEVGELCRWGTPERETYRGQVMRRDKGEGLAHTFQFQGFGFDEPPTPVAVELRAQGEVVMVLLEHDCRGAPRTRAMISSVGWQKALSRLKTLLETGRPMPWPVVSSGPEGE